MPRKISVISAAVRVAEQLQCTLGSLVGYSLPFENKVSSETRIKFVSYKLFLKEVQIDPLLKCYSVIILDDIHEMSLEIELSLFLVKRIIQERNLNNYSTINNLKLIISSANLEIENLKKYFEEKSNRKSDIILKTDQMLINKNDIKMLQVNILQITKKNFPVQLNYLKTPTSNIINLCVNITNSIIELLLKEDFCQKENDFLVFLPGKHEIDIFSERINLKIKESIKIFIKRKY